MISWLINRASFFLQGVKWPNQIKLRGVVFLRNRGCISIGEGVKINSGLRKNPTSGLNKTVLVAYKESKINIGDNVGISNAIIVSKKSIKIGARALIGCGVKIWDTDFHSLSPEVRNSGDYDVKSAAVEIGEDVFIGANSIILKGVTVADKAVIAAGSVVVKNIGYKEVWGGNPAKKIR
ncbi:acyltransferase [Akkermansiaceae bacterium]|nr:acyltransferase [Akkermansiaceae bacterium]MDA7872302.1 acyltransferase [Akkermansiaceae bacterium]